MSPSSASSPGWRSGRATGAAGICDVSLFNAALALQQSSLASYLADGDLPVQAGSAAPALGAEPGLPYGGRLDHGSGLYARSLAPAVRDARTRRALADDPRFATSPLRVANRAAMVEALTAVFVTRGTDAWLAALQAVDILCARVATYDDVAQHPQVAANRMFADIPHAALGTIRMPGFAIDSAVSNAAPMRPAPACGEHTAARRAAATSAMRMAISRRWTHAAPSDAPRPLPGPGTAPAATCGRWPCWGFRRGPPA